MKNQLLVIGQVHFHSDEAAIQIHCVDARMHKCSFRFAHFHFPFVGMFFFSFFFPLLLHTIYDFI